MSLEFNLSTFGLTQDDSKLDEVREYKRLLIEDGWDAAPHYNSEDIERSTKLTRDGFTASVICRPRSKPDTPNEASIAMFGPDHGYVKLPEPYSWDQVLKNYRTRVYEKGFKTNPKFHNPTSVIVRDPN